MIKYGLNSRPTSKVYIISTRSTLIIVLHDFKRYFEALQTISKHKQNKDIQKVDLDTCHLAFAFQKCVMVIEAAIYNLSGQN